MRPKLELINVTQTFQSSAGESDTTALAAVAFMSIPVKSLR